ncbi:MAG: winged helix-turn-helix transcriptional regulator [Oculatellaceae cyanobacterium Prado106]|nr:winged helix-turn-helix transcriptional regulator [Oculatellaceae cyanobacterium Prado106]
MKTALDTFSNPTIHLIALFENCLGYKWTIYLLTQIRQGINRPSSLVKTKKELTAKVLIQCLTRLIQFGIVEKLTYPELPPHVEYRLTPFGQEFAEILDQIEFLQQQFKMNGDRAIENLKLPH